MKQFLIFVKKEWLHILRDRRTLFILFGMPVAQILIFGFALSNEVKNSKIAILDHSNDAVSQYLIQKIEASNYFEIVENLDSDLEIDAVFKKGNVRLVLVFEPAFSEKLLNQHEASIQLISDASDPNVGTTLVNLSLIHI